jgi:hypothetical protein
VQGGVLDNANGQAKKVVFRVEDRTCRTAVLFPRIRNKFLVEACIGELSIALDRDSTTRGFRSPLQDQKKIIQNVSGFAGLKMYPGNGTEPHL